MHKLVRSSKFPLECRKWLQQILSLAILNVFFFTKEAEFTKESNEKICEVVSGVNDYYGVMYNRGPYVIEARVLNQEPEEE